MRPRQCAAVTETRVRFLDLQAQYAALRSEIRAAVDAVFETQGFVLGPTVAGFEAALGRYLGTPHVIGVASGTDALYLALRAAGVGSGDAVVTTPYSFVASATQIARTGARPYFGDIERDSFNLDPAGVRRFLTEECRREGGVLRAPGGEIVRAILPVHLFGRPCAITELAALAEEHGLEVIEDAAQAIGARIGEGGAAAGSLGGAGGTIGRACGTIGRFGCFSFYPTKNLGGAGDGGCVVTAGNADAERVRSLARHGAEGGPYRHVALGLASRLDAVQAAVLGVKLRHVDAWNAARRHHAERYDHLLTGAFGSARALGAPELVPGHVFHQYVVRVGDRERVRATLAAAGIETQVYYPIPLHLQPCFAGLGYRDGDRPEAERASVESLALPIYPELSDGAARAVVDALVRAVGEPRA
jgi:dTDP-4-amino-4,6-dideoxygalactose transaminase